MLHIIGWILKCILILMAIVIGIILLLLATVLFVPIRYEGKAEFPGEVEKITAALKVTWLLHLVCADVNWKEEELRWKVRVVWKTFGESEKGKSETETVEEISKKKEEPKVEPLKKEIPEKDVSKKESPKEEIPKKAHSEDDKHTTEKQEKESSSKNSKKKEPFLARIKKKVKEIWQQIKYTIQKICDKIKEGNELKNEVLTFLKEKVHKRAFCKLKKELIWLKRFFKITKADIRLRFGFEDPSITGQVLGALGVLYALVEGNIDVTPDFQEKCLEGQVYLKGRMRIIYIVIPTLRLIVDKAVRQTYKDFREWKESQVSGGEDYGRE